MQTLHIVSHTHWDREWYKPFQQFRLQLVHLVDNLLVILDQDPEYLHFMLDGADHCIGRLPADAHG